MCAPSSDCAFSVSAGSPYGWASAGIVGVDSTVVEGVAVAGAQPAGEDAVARAAVEVQRGAGRRTPSRSSVGHGTGVRQPGAQIGLRRVRRPRS